uniref:Uncharacterized protein n=1 Tax=Panagrolaimus sp. ES5 TaxID=591445 RepID=A0AC34GS58_9BILA
MFNNATVKQWQKLQKLCKLFFLQHRYLIIQDIKLLSNTNNIFFGTDSLKLSATNPIFRYLQNIWLTGTFKAHSNIIHSTRLISKISHCDIHTLSVAHYLVETDFDILTASGNIKILSINGVVDESGDFIPVENIISKIPKAHNIEIRRSHVTRKTMRKLLGISHKAKLKNFMLQKVDDLVNVNDYYSFLKINAEKNAKFWVDFYDDDAHQSDSKKFRAMINKKLKSWQPQAEKPKFSKISLF